MSPAPHPAATARQRPPPNPTARNPQTSFSNGDDGELDPSAQSERPKGAAGRSRGEGVVNFLGRARRGTLGRERGPGPGAPAGRLPAIVYTGCAQRRTQAGRGRGGGGGRCVLAQERPRPRATFLMSRSRSPLSEMTFFFFQRKEKRSTKRVCIFILCENTQQKLFPPAQM